METTKLPKDQEGNILKNKVISTTSLSSSDNIFSPRITRSRALANYKSLSDYNVSTQRRKPSKTLFEVQNFYLNKQVKVVHQNLETIYESPVWRKGTTEYFGKSKVKRSIYLNREYRRKSKQKVKMQKKKIERSGKAVVRNPKVSDDEFRSKMLAMDSFIADDEQICQVTESQESVQSCRIVKCSGSPKKEDYHEPNIENSFPSDNNINMEVKNGNL